MLRILFAVALCLLPVAAATVDELGGDDLTVQVQQPEGKGVGTLEAAFWAQAGDPTWTVNVTALATGNCLVSVTPATGTGQVAGVVTFSMRGTACGARLTATAYDGATLKATTIAVVEAPTGSTGSVLGYWIPIGALFALLLAAIAWGNYFAFFAAMVGLWALHIPTWLLPPWAVVVLAFFSIVIPGFIRTGKNLLASLKGNNEGRERA